MFDVWLGGVELTSLILVLSPVVLLPMQLLLCFKVRNRVIRLLPAIVLALLMGTLVVLAAAVPGWDGLGYMFLAIFSAIMLSACVLGWGIWAIVCGWRSGKKER